MRPAPPDAEQPLVTVVVLNYNGAHLLPPCLDALAAQDLPPGQMAVWVVDNASTDGSLELLARDYPWIRVIRSIRNDGFAGGNNLAMRTATTPFVALTNNDARPAPDWRRNHLAPSSTTPADSSPPPPPRSSSCPASWSYRSRRRRSCPTAWTPASWACASTR